METTVQFVVSNGVIAVVELVQFPEEQFAQAVVAFSQINIVLHLLQVDASRTRILA
jgi:hypothetical protein